MKIKWIEDDYSITSFSSSSWGCCLLSENNEQVHNIVYCKAYLQDIMAAFYNEEDCRTIKWVYGENPDPAIKSCKILILSRFDIDTNLILDLLHKVEIQLKIRKSKITIVDNKLKNCKSCFVVEGSRRWNSSPVMLSLYSLLIRIGPFHSVESGPIETMEKVSKFPYQKLIYSINDSSYSGSAAKVLPKIIKNGERNIFGYTNNNFKPKTLLEEDCIYNIVHDSGIQEFHREENIKLHFPKWYDNLSKTFPNPLEKKYV